MVGHGISPSWKKHGRGQVNNNLPTCDTWFNGRTVLYNNYRYTTDPTAGNNTKVKSVTSYHTFMSMEQHPYFDNPNDYRNPGFTLQLIPGVLRRMYILFFDNAANVGMDWYIAKGGPYVSQTGKVPTKLRKVLSIPKKLINDPEFGTINNPAWPASDLFHSVDNINEPLYSGESYGYICEVHAEDQASIPTSGQIGMTIASTIYFGGGGTDDEE